MSFKAFIKSKIFLRHLIYSVFIVVAILWVSLKSLDIYTMHGKTITVPDLEGLYLEDVEHITSRLNLSYSVNDSIFDAARDKGTIANQDPLPGTQVKKDRTIYITTVAKLPEMVSMPELQDLTLRQAISILESLHINVGKLQYVPDIAQNSVIRVKYNEGIIEPGTIIEKGTYVDLVLGQGAYLSRTPVPLVVGQPRRGARLALQAASLNIGNEVFLDNDRVNARVYRQVPDVLSRHQSIQMGSNVDLYYRSDNEFDFVSYLEEVMTVDLPYLIGQTPDNAKRILENSFLYVGAEYYINNVPREDAQVVGQTPDTKDTTRVYRETRVNLWYRSIYEEADSIEMEVETDTEEDFEDID